MNKLNLWDSMLRNDPPSPAAGGASPPPPPPAAPPPPPASIASGGGAPAAADPAKAAEWKEYTPDPAKSEAENAAAKAEHDKTKPAEAKPTAAAFDGNAIKFPEGTVKDEAGFKIFSEIMSKDMTPTERGQALIDFYASEFKKMADSQTKAWNDLQDQWEKEVKADPVIGGDKLASTQQVMAKAIDSLGPDKAKAFRAALDLTGAGNNPDFNRGFFALAKQLTEGGHINGNPPPAKKSIQEEFFPNSPEMKG